MPIPLRPDFDGAKLRAAARRSKDGPQSRRLLALATIYYQVPECMTQGFPDAGWL